MAVPVADSAPRQTRSSLEKEQRNLVRGCAKSWISRKPCPSGIIPSAPAEPRRRSARSSSRRPAASPAELGWNMWGTPHGSS